MTSDPKLVQAFYRACLFVKERCKTSGWRPGATYLREHVRCATGLKFSNSRSPLILRAVLQSHPELRQYIVVKTLKKDRK